MNKRLLMLLAFLSAFVLYGSESHAKKTPRLMFEIGGLSNPESSQVFKGYLYVSNMGNKNPGKKDGDGWIGMYDLKGNPVKAVFVSGLNDPKGIHGFDRYLYIADLNEVVVVDVPAAKIEKRIALPGAEFLNDIEIDDLGNIYVSDTKKGTIFKIDGKTRKTSIFKEKMDDAPNGLCASDGRLYVVSWAQGLKPDWTYDAQGRLLSINMDSKNTEILTSRSLGLLDGIECVGEGIFIFSAKDRGKIFQFEMQKGSVKNLIDSAEDVADIGYDPDNKLLTAPLMKSGRLRVFKW